MGADRVVRWGPPALATVVTDQLERHGLGSGDAVACAQELAAAVGPAARASSFVDLGGCRFLDGDISGALAAWQQAIVSGQTAPAARALFNLGLLHEHLGLYDDAVERFEAVEAHGVAPYAGLATMARARALHHDDQQERAMAALARHADRLMEQDPASPLLAESMLGLGDVAQAAGNLERAERAYRAATDAADSTIREQAILSLVEVLRAVGHDDEAQQLLEEAGLGVAVDPAVALDRIELMVRLARFDEAESLLDELAPDQLAVEGFGVAEQFRMTSIQIDLGRVNDAIDVLEELAGSGSGETRARAAYRLGEVYLSHDMGEPAATMLGTVRGLHPGYWADKASLLLGDLAIADGRHRIAAAHWADAAASRTEAVASIARERLVEAVATPEPAEDSASDPVQLPDELTGDIAKDPQQDLELSLEAGPRTEAVDMVSLLDEEPLIESIDEDSRGHDREPPWMMPGEITPVAGILMSLPSAEPVDVIVPAEPLAGSASLPVVPAADDVSTAGTASESASPRPAPPTPAAPAGPTVIPLRRAGRTSGSGEVPVVADQDVLGDEAEATGISDESPAPTRSVPGSAAPEQGEQELDVPHPSNSGYQAETDEPSEPTALAPTDAPLVIKLGRGSSPSGAAEVSDPGPGIPAPADSAVTESESSERSSDAASSDTGGNDAGGGATTDRNADAPNPYAALAPEALADDPTPSGRNPYAELAPNFTSNPVELAAPNDEEPPSTFSQFA